MVFFTTVRGGGGFGRIARGEPPNAPSTVGSMTTGLTHSMATVERGRRVSVDTLDAGRGANDEADRK